MAADGGWGPPSGSDPGGETEVELGARPSKWWAAVAVLGVLGLLVAGALAVGRGGASRAVDTTTTTSTTAPTTSATSAASTTARAVSTTTVPTRTTFEGAPFVEVASPPGLVLYAVGRGLDRLWRVDLLTGDATSRPIANVLALVTGGIGGIDLLPRTGGVVVRPDGGPALFVPDDPAKVAVVVQPEPVGTRILPHADPSLVWRIDDRGSPSLAQAIDMTGRPAGPEVQVRAGTVVADDGTGRLVVRFAGGTYVLATDGTSSMLSAGRPLAVTADRVVGAECEVVQVACELVSRRRSDGTVTARIPAAEPFLDDVEVSLSPSGTHLAAIDRAAPGTALVRADLDGAGSSRTDVVEVPMGRLWWADDDLLCAAQPDGHVRCWRDRLGSFVLPDLIPGGVTAMAFARP